MGSATKKDRPQEFLVRHREPFWVYNRGQRIGTAHLNYVRRNGRRSLRLHIQIKKRGDWKFTIATYSVLIPLPLAQRMMKVVLKDGPVNHREKITFETLRFETDVAAAKE